MDRDTAQRRKKQAAELLRSVKSIINSLQKIPSYNGKARFMDKVFQAEKYAHNLHWDLARDAEESEK